MKALRWNSEGSNTLDLVEVSEPELGPHQVLIEVHAGSVNRVDLAIRANPAGQTSEGSPVGLDAAGVVVAVGDAVAGVRIGDRVMAMITGGLAEIVAVDAEMAMRIPDRWSFADGAAAIVGLMTEHNALCTTARMVPGESVVVHGARSAVGMQCVQLARHLGAGVVVATVRAGRGSHRLHELGADVVIEVGTDGRFAAQVRQATNGIGAAIVIDHVGGPYLAESLAAMGVGGRLVSVGRLAGGPGLLDLELVALNRLSLFGVTFRTRSATQKADVLRLMRDDLADALEVGALWPTVDHAVAWADAETAHAAITANEHFGKVVLVVRDAPTPAGRGADPASAGAATRG